MSSMTDTFSAFAAMPYSDDEIYPVTRITTGALGDPGYRVLVLQAQFGPEIFSWVIEKQQALTLVRAIPQLLADVRSEFPELSEPLVAAEPNLTLAEPFAPLFRVGGLGLGYDRVYDLVVLTLVDARVWRGELETDPEDEGDEMGHRIYTTRGQALLLSQQTERIVAAGRPYCPECGEPIDDFGHFCLPLSARNRQTGDTFH